MAEAHSFEMINQEKGIVRNVTQEDVARRAGVSRSIVSYVINNGPRSVSEVTKTRVLDAIRELGYRPNKHAQMLSGNEDTVTNKYIGIVLAENFMFKRPYYGSILASIHEYAHERGYHIRFIRVFGDFNNPALFNELVHPNEISGAILLGLDQVIRTSEDRALVEQIVKRVERVVCVDWQLEGVPSVQFSRQDASYQATNHLLDNGRKCIAYIGPDDKRLPGYQQALWERRITPNEQWVRFAVDSQPAYECCEGLLQSEPAIDAICAGTDEVAFGILKCLHQHGRRVPHDIAVASIDNIDVSAYTIPALTTVDVPKKEIGYHALLALTSDLADKAPSAFSITVRTQLVVRESSVPH